MYVTVNQRSELISGDGMFSAYIFTLKATTIINAQEVKVTMECVTNERIEF